MWAFRSFPETIEYVPSGKDRPVYQVEVFGYLELNKNIFGLHGNLNAYQLIAFREKAFWIAGQDDIGEIKFLKINEFEKKFKGYTLKEP